MTVFRLGLTGSIGMGKTTTAALFREAGIPVWSADDVVARIYAGGGEVVAKLRAAFPAAVQGGHVHRPALREALAGDPGAFAVLEAIVHPFVVADRERFLAGTACDLAVLDIPLLFETGAEGSCDATLLATAPADLQRRRVLARPGMTEAHLALILARQMPDAEKRARATHVVETLSIESTRAYVQALVAHIRSREPAAGEPARTGRGPA